MNKTQFLEGIRDDATTIMEAIERLRNKRAVLASLGGVRSPGNTNGWLDPAETVGPLEETLTVADAIAVLATTGEALDGLLAEGHATNLNKIRR